MLRQGIAHTLGAKVISTNEYLIFFFYKMNCFRKV